MLSYAARLTEAPSLVDAAAVDSLREAGWGDQAVWEITALVSYFNFTGRMEAASGLPPDEIPTEARFAEGKAD